MYERINDGECTTHQVGSKGTNSPIRPSDAFRRAVREMRKRRGWSAEELAERLRVDRSTVTKLEKGERGVSLDDAFSYAATLGVQPSAMIAPRDATPVQITATESVDGHIFRAWLRGHTYIRPEDVPYFPAEVDIDEWVKRWKVDIHLVLSEMQKLVDALGEAIDPDAESARTCAIGWTV